MDTPLIRAVKALFFFGPLLFGVGFLAPLIAQTTVALELEPPFSLQPLIFGLALGGGLGLIAQIRGRWI